jgi:tRNA (cmo5U34)-methyltransferase
VISSLNHDVALGTRWEFDEKVAGCFSDMLERSIPQYEGMRKLVAQIGRHILESKDVKTALDLGCSTGIGLEELAEPFPKGLFVGVDSSEAMVKEACLRLKGKDNLYVRQMDLRQEFPKGKYHMVTAILTIQFIPLEHRLGVLQSVYDCLHPGGVFLFVEKVLGGDPLIHELLVDQYHKFKLGNGYTTGQVANKRASLENVLVPVTSDWNKDMLKSAGFSRIECFWRCLNFEGLIAMK